MPDRNAIPRFFLYGDAKQEVERDFLHIERIRIRSSQHDWTIRPHAHPDHTQLLLVMEGGGVIQVEAESWRTGAPCLLVIPATAVHAIAFVPGTDGFVVTAAASFLDAAIGPDKEIGARSAPLRKPPDIIRSPMRKSRSTASLMRSAAST